MLLISKIVSQLILPPGGLIVWGGACLLFWRRAWARLLLALMLLFSWMLSTEVVRDMLSQPLEFQFPALHGGDVVPEHAVIVLLGGGVYENAPEYGGQDMLHTSALLRTDYALYLAKKTGMDVYATGGRPLNVPQDAEGDVMRRWLIAHGLNKDHVFAETKANNTWENAKYVQSLLAKQGVSDVVLVTSAWHMPRSVWCFESQGLQVIPAPTDYLTKQGRYDVRSYLPSGDALHESIWALHEYLGLWFYRWRYA